MKNIFLTFTFILSILPLIGQNMGIDSIIAEKKIIVQTRKFQDKLNKEYADPSTSPLDSADLVRFSSLNFYPSNQDAVVSASFITYPKVKKFKMKTSTARKPLYNKYGEVKFTFQGKEYKLIVYQNLELIKEPGFENYLFLPFTDLTNGETTYGGGRYIDLRIPNSDTITIDFNKAYNPYCAYSHRYSCPIPPSENFLNVKMEAGVKEGLTYK